MLYTNRFNLPPPVVKALSTDDYEKHGDYSVTELINPPRLSFLKRRHAHEITVDVMSHLWSMRGRAMHYIMSMAKVPGALVEQRFIMPFKGIQVSMQPDYIYPYKDKEFELLDFKDTSVYAIKDGVKEEWIKQDNIYRKGFGFQGHNITSMKNVVILKDWSYTDCHIKKTYKYPNAEVQIVDVPIWPEEQVDRFLTERITLFESCKMLPDNQLPECSIYERWGTLDTFAVVKLNKEGKEGNAVRGGTKFKTRVEAEAFQEERWKKAEDNKSKSIKRNDTTIQYREGEPTKRCERYCEAKAFCSQYKQLRKDPF